jgi:Dyp-type peroxidase family
MPDLNSAPVDHRDLAYDTLFSNLQGNILKGHGREHTNHIFIKFDQGRKDAAKKWIKKFSEEKVTSCKTQLRETELFKRNKISGGTFYGFHLSAEGYNFLNIAITPFDDSFKDGMKSANLNDPPVAEWEAGLADTVHAMILIADSDLLKLGQTAKEIIEQVDKFSKILTIEYGNAIKNANGDGLEHFGYVDGISQPLFFKDEVEKNLKNNITPLKFDPIAPFNLVLVADPHTTEPDAFGSYFVFRKLEQNVKGFKKAEKALASAMGLEGEDDERAGAMLVGRFEDGSPVTLSSTAAMISSGVLNNFDYSDDGAGAKCPFHAHIRKSNPRGPGDKSRIMARRGIPFGHRNVGTEVDPSLPQMPSGGVGLLFMSYQKHLASQFEFIQSTWVNNENFPFGNAGTDPLIGQDGGTNKSTGKFAKEYGNAISLEEHTFNNFIKMKGGEYFFTPSIPFMNNLWPETNA